MINPVFTLVAHKQLSLLIPRRICKNGRKSCWSTSLSLSLSLYFFFFFFFFFFFSVWGRHASSLCWKKNFRSPRDHGPCFGECSGGLYYSLSWCIWTEKSFLNIDLIGLFSKCHLICLLIFVVIRLYYILRVDISVIKLWIKMIPVKWYDIISLHGFELSNQIDCNNSGIKNCFGGKNCFAVLSMLSCTSTWWLAFFKHVICNKQIITC